MNILVSTTLNWNPGDEFIRYGVMKLFEEVFGNNHNYLVWNRNPDAINQKLGSNSIAYDELEQNKIDMILIAGSPDWYSNSYIKLFDYLKQHPEIPLLAIGIGSPFKNIQLTDLEKEIYNRPNTFVTCRDTNVKNFVSKAIVLPCPALFCSDVVQEKDNGKTLFITQIDSVINQSVDKITHNILQSELSKDADIMCFYKSEWTWYSKNFQNVQYTFEPKELIERISKYKHIVSTRLHGAVAATSSGIPSKILSYKDNFRIISTAKELEIILPVIYNDINNEDGYTTKDNIQQFKEETKQKYIMLLNGWKNNL